VPCAGLASCRWSDRCDDSGILSGQVLISISLFETADAAIASNEKAADLIRNDLP